MTGAEGGIHFLGLPVTNFDYSSSIIPAILTAWVMSYIERLMEKITPAFTKKFLKLKLMLILLVSTPIAFLILGPLGSIIGNAHQQCCTGCSLSGYRTEVQERRIL
ncbi:PTS transporter subunit EIIC [Butyricicoccus sp.]|uniref:PTS transporter subunit EIIC n=1 Tax=Butyricicoccus sp. TaxID=2049021 RepID=UPI003D7C8DF6